MKRIPTGFVPVDDQAQFEVSMRAPEGTSAEETALVAERVAQQVRGLDGVAHSVVTVAGGDAQVQNLASIYVALTDPKTRQVTQLELMDRTRREILKKLPKELRVTVAEVAAISTGSATAAVQYVLSGPDLAKIEQLSAKMIPLIRKNPAVVDLDTNLIVGKPELRVSVDRDRASDLGVSVADVAGTLRSLVAGAKVGSYAEHGEEYDVRVRAEREYRSDASALGLLSVPSRKGGTRARLLGGDERRCAVRLADQSPRAAAPDHVHGERRAWSRRERRGQGDSGRVRRGEGAARVSPRPDGSLEVLRRARCGLPARDRHVLRVHVPDPRRRSSSRGSTRSSS